LKAFRLDATKKRYPDWGELMAYCALSAMPVGRFVLDVHGESPATWPASDAICAALQIINHLQDCGEDYRELDRVYVPLDGLAAHGAGVEALGAGAASPGVRACVADLSRRCEGLLRDGAALTDEVMDWRLRLEISVIQSLALRLTDLLIARDPLAGKVHLGKWEAGGAAIVAMARAALRGRRFASRPAPSEARP
jgi:phytoene/squalene synthetase